MGINENENPYSFNAEDMTVTLHLENGVVECAIVVILTVEDNDYIVLMPLEDDEENKNGDVWFYRYFENENDSMSDPILEYIESDETFEAVSKAFDEFLDDAEFDELIVDEE